MLYFHDTNRLLMGDFGVTRDESPEPQKYLRTKLYAPLFENLVPTNPLTALGFKRTLVLNFKIL